MAGVDILSDSTGKSIVAAIQSTDVAQARISEINQAAESKKNEVLASIPEDYRNTVEEVNQLKGDLGEIYRVEKSKNLFNKDDITIGAIQSDGTISTLAAWGNYRTSDFISIDNGYYTASYVDGNGNIVNPDRIVLLMFDVNYNPIKSTYQNVTETGFLTVLNENAKYVRLSFPAGLVPNAQFEKGSTYSAYVEYYRNKKINEDVNINEITNELKNNIIENCVKLDKNLVDTSKSTIGYLESYGSIETYELYATTDFIPVKIGTKYKITPKIRKFILFDYNKNLIAGTFLDIDSSSEYSFISEYDGYMRFTYYKEDESNIKCYSVREGTFEENINMSQTMKSEVLGLISNELSGFHSGNVLHNKKWYACGDSFTEWTTEQYDQSIYPNIIGSDNKHYKTYPWWIGARNEMEVVNIANSGMTLAMPENPGTFTNAFSRELYTQIPSDVDYITLMFGINDGHHRNSSSAGDGEDNTGVIPLGTIDDTTNATFYGAWNVVLKYLIENHPDAHIGVIVSIGCDTDEYPRATIECAKKWGIPYLDLDGDYRYPLILRHKTRPDTCDEAKQLRTVQYRTNESNTHPNVKGHERMSYIVENFLRYI